MSRPSPPSRPSWPSPPSSPMTPMSPMEQRAWSFVSARDGGLAPPGKTGFWRRAPESAAGSSVTASFASGASVPASERGGGFVDRDMFRPGSVEVAEEIDDGDATEVCDGGEVEYLSGYLDPCGDADAPWFQHSATELRCSRTSRERGAEDAAPVSSSRGMFGSARLMRVSGRDWRGSGTPAPRRWSAMRAESNVRGVGLYEDVRESDASMESRVSGAFGGGRTGKDRRAGGAPAVYRMSTAKVELLAAGKPWHTRLIPFYGKVREIRHGKESRMSDLFPQPIEGGMFTRFRRRRPDFNLD
jgi:hypothetical protein